MSPTLPPTLMLRLAWLKSSQNRSHDRLKAKEPSRLCLRLLIVGLLQLSVAQAFVGAQEVVSRASAIRDGVVTEEFIYEDAPFPQCHAATLEETSTGIIAAWFGGTREGADDVGIWVSRRSAEGWEAPQEVANGIQYRLADGSVKRYPCWNPVLIRTADEKLWLFYKVGPNPREWWGMVTHSTDEGETWDTPRRLPEGILGPVKNKPILLEEQTLLAGSSTEHDGWRVHCEISKAPFVNWHRTPALHDGKEVGLIQPTLCLSSSGVISMFCRDQNGKGKVWMSTSEDKGITWSRFEPTVLPNPNSGIDAVTLQDDRILLVYNHTQRGTASPAGREMLNVALTDDGKNWQAALVLENEPKAEFSYPAVIQTSDGMVHILYTWKRRRVKHVVVDPERLKSIPIKDGAWPEL